MRQQPEQLRVEVFERVMECALEPLADRERQPQSFFEGYRLLGVDGRQWSVGNTPAVLAQLPNVASRRLRAAFAKLRLVSVVELGTHAPVAARAGPVGESEQALAGKLWGDIPGHSLGIGDRLFGVPLTVWQARQGCSGRASTFWCGCART